MGDGEKNKRREKGLPIAYDFQFGKRKTKPPEASSPSKLPFLSVLLHQAAWSGTHSALAQNHRRVRFLLLLGAEQGSYLFWVHLCSVSHISTGKLATAFLQIFVASKTGMLPNSPSSFSAPPPPSSAWAAFTLLKPQFNKSHCAMLTLRVREKGQWRA